ncbi:dynactin p62 family-domain-containing protein [Lipomyces kononenkoae]|uniref:Dynactin p62 family-domain-containing protein n=1 Tax=Lipomyces kononenkoae TaxID=34357 RepID=A0ACC3T1I6_LIPKO
MTARRYPFLRIHCPCAEPVTDDQDDSDPESLSKPTPPTPETTTTLELPPSLESPFALHTLNSLYFCDVCMVLRCERCVVEEVVQTYCPACLHVYSADTAGGGNEPSKVTRKGVRGDDVTFCTRNCLQCPLCFTNLIMLSQSISDSSEASGTVYLQCPHCSWDSRRQPGNLTFSKHSSLYQQIRQIASNTKADENREASDPTTATTASRFSALSSFYQQLYDSLDAEEEQSNAHSAPPSPLFPKRANRSLETIRFLKSHYSRQQGPASSSPSLPAVTPASVLGELGRAGGVPSHKAREYEENEKERYVEYIGEEAEQEEALRVRDMTSLDISK